MKFLKKIWLFIVLPVLFTTGMYKRAESQVAVTAHAFAEVMESLAAVETSQLNFGSFSPETEGGKIQISPEGARNSQGTVVLAKGMYNAASFYLTGESNSSFSISLPTSPVALTNTSSAKTMLVTDWESSPAQGFGVGVLEGGSKVVSVGATLIVGTIQDNPKGEYTGTYAITFDYN
jgi:hypothetical protein